MAPAGAQMECVAKNGLDLLETLQTSQGGKESSIAIFRGCPAMNGALNGIHKDGKPELREITNGLQYNKGMETECAIIADQEEEDEEEEEYVNYFIPEDPLKDYGIDARDANTPDRWIKRHPELVRLTGKHPFNCEPPLHRLVDHGFITPVPIHYVRNHGAVPHTDWDTWRIEVGGLVRRTLSLSMADLMAFPSRTIPVTLVCVGNRRKEQNMVKQTIGFSWGAGAVSTSIYKGVLLRDVLVHCGVLSRKKGAKNVCFEGAETLPGGGGSKYGTSIAIERAMDESYDVMLAYEQNGEPLTPDHGFPVRLIIPGYIGGRMVKWLKKIVVTEMESSNYYHFHDNRVLPSYVDAERATKEGWWYKPEYICNELSINSAMSAPAHGEVLPVTPNAGCEQYLLKGYAYSGGGRKVTRVEVTLDDGLTWRLAELDCPERPTKYGRYWCWCFWKLPVDVMDLLQAKEMSVRAWDAGTNTQPEHLTWNVMGMMNNCWFRVRIHPTRTNEGGLGLTFEHPTRPGNQTGGWMVKHTESSERMEHNADTSSAKPKALAKTASLPQISPSLRQIPLSEIRKHDDETSAWIVVHEKVYDVTKFLEDHPGGAESILINAGTDCTEEFDAIHSDKAKAMLEDYLIGQVAAVEPVGNTPDSSVRGGQAFGPDLETISEGRLAIPKDAPLSARPVALSQKLRIPFPLMEKKILSHDTRLFRFGLQSPDHVLGLPVGKHMLLSATINGKFVMRAYTPTSLDEEIGHFDLVVKVYFRGVIEQFPEGGLMSQHLESLKIGDTIDVKGPVGHIHYQGKGHFTSNGKPKFAKRIAMMAGGTGITPMFQVVKAILKDPEDMTEVWLLFANRTEQDVLLREDLDKWEAEHKNFHLWYTIGSPAPPGWKFSTGRMNEYMLREHLPAGSEDTVAFMCGPPGMIKDSCIPNLEKMGYSLDQMFTF